MRNTLTINAGEQELVVDACDDYCMADIVIPTRIVMIHVLDILKSYYCYCITLKQSRQQYDLCYFEQYGLGY